MTRKMRPSNEVQAAYDRAIERMALGATQENARRAEGLSSSVFATYRDKNKKPSQIESPAKRSYKTRRKPTFVDVPLKANAHSSVAIIVCQPKDIKEVLAGLQ